MPRAARTNQEIMRGRRGTPRRGGSTERGYDYGWQKFRQWRLRRDPICQDCNDAAATEVHEVDPPGGGRTRTIKGTRCLC